MNRRKSISINLRRFRSSRGGSLVEMLLVCLMLIMIISTAYSLFIPGIHLMKRGEKSIESQQNAFKTINSLGSGLRDSSFESFYFKTIDDDFIEGLLFPIDQRISIRAVSFMSAVDDGGRFIYDNASGRPKWQKFIVYYLVEKDEIRGVQRYRLYRKEYKSALYHLPSLTPQMITQLDMNSLISNTDNAKLVADNISRLEFFEASLKQIGIAVYTYGETPDRRGEESVISTRILLRN